MTVRSVDAERVAVRICVARRGDAAWLEVGHRLIALSFPSALRRTPGRFLNAQLPYMQAMNIVAL
jgi:hypothetical protein